MEFFPVSWSSGDTGPGDTFRVTAFGKTPDGDAVCVHVRFTPYFFVRLDDDWSAARGRLFVAEAARKYGALPERSCVVERASLWGYDGKKTRLFAQLAFGSLTDFRRARYRLKSDGHKTFEASVDPVVRLFHLRGIGPAQWVRVGAWADPARLVADVDTEVECAFTALCPSDRVDRPPLVFASEFLGGGV